MVKRSPQILDREELTTTATTTTTCVTKYDAITNLRLDVIDGRFSPGPVVGSPDGFVHAWRPQPAWSRLAEEGDDDEVDREHDQVAGDAGEDLQGRKERKMKTFWPYWTTAHAASVFCTYIQSKRIDTRTICMAFSRPLTNCARCGDTLKGLTYATRCSTPSFPDEFLPA